MEFKCSIIWMLLITLLWRLRLGWLIKPLKRSAKSSIYFVCNNFQCIVYCDTFLSEPKITFSAIWVKLIWRIGPQAAIFAPPVTGWPLFLPWTTLDRWSLKLHTENIPKELQFWRCLCQPLIYFMLCIPNCINDMQLCLRPLCIYSLLHLFVEPFFLYHPCAPWVYIFNF